MISTISKPVSQALILLWTHPRGEMSNKTIPDAANTPLYSIVDKAGAEIDPTVEGFDGTTAYGVHLGAGQVYWAHSVFNDLYIHWPDGISDADKNKVIDHLENTFLIIKQD
ncbi:hypothetical protein [Photobacterium atrarenae]|uniref:Uncharacterized protein n=1 Tax=Photobacterium atrarenae TaxID=865757 RepID=A0ABY5GB34_9GAMM|nr:hypothetical protein [Photobacterium atrarenae]UTV26389.1 hypothetical protein NNL38_08325 [Photobacterium atrarenae]